MILLRIRKSLTKTESKIKIFKKNPHFICGFFFAPLPPNPPKGGVNLGF